jgi:hypothetical protein
MMWPDFPFPIPKDISLTEESVSPVEVLARVVDLVIAPERLATLEADYAGAVEMIEDLHSVETTLVPEPFDPGWPEAGQDDRR